MSSILSSVEALQQHRALISEDYAGMRGSLAMPEIPRCMTSIIDQMSKQLGILNELHSRARMIRESITGPFPGGPESPGPTKPAPGKLGIMQSILDETERTILSLAEHLLAISQVVD